MTTLWKNPSTGKLLKLPGGDLMGDDTGCCCEDPCCASGSPTSDFYFTLDDDDPCTVDFFDMSEEGDCGAITSWSWKCSGTEFSTSQNPANVNLETLCGSAPFSITLTITDASGCTDTTSAVTINCVPCDYTLQVTDISESAVDDCNYTYSATINNPTGKTIIQYLWYVGGVLVGTGTTLSYQDPSACPGFLVKLVIVDQNGCTAQRQEAFSHNTCTNFCDCYQLDDAPGATVSVTLSGVLQENTSTGGTCTTCEDNNTTYELAQVGTLCQWEYQDTFDCDGTSYTLKLTLGSVSSSGCFDEWRCNVSTWPTGNTSLTVACVYRRQIADSGCIGTWALTWLSSGGGSSLNECPPPITSGAAAGTSISITV